MNNALFLWEVLWVIRAKICNLLTDTYIHHRPLCEPESLIPYLQFFNKNTFEFWSVFQYMYTDIFHLKFPTKRIIIKHFFDCVAKQQLTCIIGVRSGKHLRGCKSIRMWPKKRFGLLYMAWMSDNKFNIGPGHTIDSNHGLCWSSSRLACK